MTNNYHSIYPQKLNQEFIDIVTSLYQIKNQIKTCIEKQKNELNNLSKECQDSNLNLVEEIKSDAYVYGSYATDSLEIAFYQKFKSSSN